MSKVTWMMKAWVLFLLSMAAAFALPAQTFINLHSFDGTDGEYPHAELVQGSNGNLYGTTFEGGTDNSCALSSPCGTVFEITPRGTLTTLHSFGLTDGSTPAAAVVQGTDGNLYGTTSAGGVNGFSSYGTVFKMTPSGVLTTLHSFDFTDGQDPHGLVEGTDGDFYGTTQYGGAYDEGTVFKITPTGTVTTLHSFGMFGPDGSEPFWDTGPGH
jgi:uncharacterized repeat protein (TIGR03803 family)